MEIRHKAKNIIRPKVHVYLQGILTRFLLLLLLLLLLFFDDLSVQTRFVPLTVPPINIPKDPII